MPDRTPFRNVTQLNAYLPARVWDALRILGMLGAIAVAALLVWRPQAGLELFWGLIVPLLPAVFMLTPGVWRNLCPLASSNQTPRRLGLARTLAQKSLPTGAAFPVGIGMFVAAIVGRKLMFNASGPASAALILGAMGAAFVGGIVYKGKSGWCSSICPLLPVQRLYGQTPFVKVANTQCNPCVACAKNCYDFNPEEAYLADQYDSDPHYREFRRFFAGIFPGLVLGFYLVPDIDMLGPVDVLLQMFGYMAGSLAVFTLLDLIFKATPNRMPVLSAAVAINIYYWFAAPVVLRTLSHVLPSDATLLGAVRAAIAIASIVWIARSIRAEHRFLKEQVRLGKHGEINLAPVVVQTVRVHRHIVPRRKEAELVVAPVVAANSARIEGGDTAPGALRPIDGASPTSATKRELRIDPEGRCVPIKSGSSLLDALERCGADIAAGCRAGACGGDPIAVTEGSECLGPIGDTERSTLARLGHAPNTRMACMARVRKPGTIAIELRPHGMRLEEAAGAARNVTEPAVFDVSITRVVIIGNGVAGLTAAATLRRHHPACQIHLVSREQHAPYNRIAVSGLISRPAGLPRLTLKPEAWFEAQRITQWRGASVVAIDTLGQGVRLASGEVLAYDRLIIASGSQAWAPPVAGFGMPGTFTLRDPGDAMAIHDHARRPGVRRAVVVGAGLLGLEAAAELRKLGLVVQVLSQSDQVLDRQIDRAASALVVEHLAGLGIELVERAMLDALIEADGRLQAIALEDGRRLDAELLVVCAGTRADAGVALAAGIACGRGITVDASMRTSAVNVHAAGDVAEFEGQQFGLWSVAIAQGEAAARSALGLPAGYEAALPATALKLRGIEVRSAGAPNAEGRKQVELFCEGLEDSADGPRYCKLVAEERPAGEGGDRLIGAVIVGRHDGADELLDAVRCRRSLAALREVLRDYRWTVVAKAPRPKPSSAVYPATTAAASADRPAAAIA